MQLKLIVLRTPDQKALADFYTLLGLKFDYHKHGNSPYHYSAHIDETVLEIYPLSKTQTAADKDLRLGLSIENFESTMTALRDANVNIVTPATQTEWGYMAVIQDPDGRKIEIYKG